MENGQREKTEKVKSDIEILRVKEGSTRELKLQEWFDHEGLNLPREQLPEKLQAVQVFVEVINHGEDSEEIQVRSSVSPELLDQHNLGWGRTFKLSAGERAELLVLVPLFPVTGLSYLPYSGPLRYWIRLVISSDGLDFYEQSLPVDAPPLQKKEETDTPVDFDPLIHSVQKSTLIREFNMHQEQKGEGLDFITFSLDNIGKKRQFLGLDIKVLSSGEDLVHRRQYFYEIDACSCSQIRADFFHFEWKAECILVNFVAIPEKIYRRGLKNIFLLKSIGQTGRENLYSSLISRFEFHLSKG